MKRKILYAVILAMIFGVACSLWSFLSGSNDFSLQDESDQAISSLEATSIEDLIARSTQFIEEKNYKAAVPLIERCLKIAPANPDMLLLAGRAAGELGKIDEAIMYCDRVPHNIEPHAEIAAWVPCELLFQAGRYSTAEVRMGAFLKRYPYRSDSRMRLIYVFNLSGRNFEAVPHLLFLVQNQQFGIEALLFLSDLEKVIDYSEQLNRATDSSFSTSGDQADLVSLLGLARLALANRQFETAEKLLRQVFEFDDSSVESFAMLGELYYETGQIAKLDSWELRLNDHFLTHPQIWFVRGLAARDSGQSEWAVKYFWEAIRRNPTSRRSLFALGQALESIGKTEEAEQIRSLHQSTSDYIRLCEGMFGRKPKLDEMIQASRLCIRNGRLWEAWGWAHLACFLDQNGTVAQELRIKLQPQLDSLGRNQIAADQHPAMMVDIGSIDYPKRSSFSSAETRIQVANEGLNQSQESSIQFSNDAESSNFRFQYFDAADATTEGKRIYEFGGGGVGALDMDRDGFVDVYMTQGTTWPPGSDSGTHRNSLKRNVNGRSFIEVSELASVDDRGFGQGVAIGDVNSDGFPDIYVANIGSNRMYLNQGDGTYQASFDKIVTEDNRWTTSCLLADLNGDGNPDIYDVNYLQGEDIFDRVCVWEGNRLRICGPATFQSAQDRLLMGSGGLSFRNVTQESGIVLPGGAGLGIVAGDFRGAGSIDVFVANDQQKNFYFTSDANDTSTSIKFIDRSVVMGTAFDANGLAQACMGVAVGDADGNGLADLFITNFYRESNTLYSQSDSGYFEDVSRTAGLRDASFEMLGFGTQFLDMELDGDLDLVITNGHLDDFTYLNQPYQMPLQVYRNDGNGSFQPVPNATLGSYFEGLYRGRGLARLDWNVDGVEDFIVSQLDSPAALLTNRSVNRGQSVTLELIGVRSNRDAIGSRVTVQVGGQTLSRGLYAGDGYQASNERILVFGLGEQAVVHDVVIQWPSGLQQRIERPLQANGRYLLVEGHEVVTLSELGN